MAARWPQRRCLKQPSSDALKPAQGAGQNMRPWVGTTADIELKNASDHDDGLRPIAVFEHHKFQSLRAVDEEATAQPLLILHNPPHAAVFSNAEQIGLRAGMHRRRFVRAPGILQSGYRAPVTFGVISCLFALWST